MASPRIIAGTARGIRLKPVPGDTTRPVTDRVKEALFNILGADVQGSSWLDLYGGTGSIGIEALSRGAKFVRFNDLNRQAVVTIRENLEKTRLSHGAEVFQGDALALLRRRADRQFDYVYVAPPQYKGMWIDALAELDSNLSWLYDNSWVIVQIAPVEYQEQSLKNLELIDDRQYGSTLLLFYEVKEGAVQA
ncbi:MAG TPA: 16S rRNA (guanine(966)-N(2))-methyltransferase RsmD [Chloroflexi bacterium]|nr:16S rRNA (guanine(966)-N(2))-methyltransferase RsmD [Chloroflexota bacterium]HPO59315.1 16S rRNA (guanine(966)-N(2))-methyltransferase RsmD [Anaerolineaceae bacterium]